jgi:3-hydroxypropanoate dehydrogenase
MRQRPAAGSKSGGAMRTARIVDVDQTSIRSNFLCNLGLGDPAKVLTRSPRLTFEEACRLL